MRKQDETTICLRGVEGSSIDAFIKSLVATLEEGLTIETESLQDVKIERISQIYADSEVRVEFSYQPSEQEILDDAQWEKDRWSRQIDHLQESLEQAQAKYEAASEAYIKVAK